VTLEGEGAIALAGGRLAGKVAAITGGGSGLGLAIASLFSSEGARVAVIDVDRGLGGEAVKTIRRRGGEAMFAEASVSKSSDVEKAIKSVVQRYGRLDILVNNAGVASKGSVVDLTEEAWDKVIAVNLKGVFLCSRYGVAEMAKTGQGVVVNIGSVLGLVGSAGEAAYCASKGGVIALTRAMALDFARLNIRVNCVCPGSILTPMFERLMTGAPNNEEALKRNAERIPMGRVAKPEEVAGMVLYLASDESSYATGSIMTIDGGWTAY
jgi:NAD(P)-dependent dehydrogenase (short-subunit alcohol dehydrogenase family)